TLWKARDAQGDVYCARSIAVGIGRKPNIPTIPGLQESDRIVHLTRYLPAVRQLPSDATVAVLGASQSAVEILLDLRARGIQNIASIPRSFSYRLKDTSQFSDEVYFPDFVDYYHSLSKEKRRLLDDQVRQTNYSCADGDIIAALYQRLYEDSL